MSEDIKKLPKWVQWKIESLEKSLADVRSTMDSYAGTTVTSVRVDPEAEHMRNGAYPRFLPNRTNIEYTLPNGDEIDVSFRNGELRISASGPGVLVVKPQASNAVIVGTVTDRE